MSAERGMPPELAGWLRVATRGLSTESCARVRDEIRMHYEAARDDARDSGSGFRVASRVALESLGDPHTVNRAYRAVLLTRSEAEWLDRIESDPVPASSLSTLVVMVAVFSLVSVIKQDVREVLGWIGILAVLGGHLLLPGKTLWTGRAHRFTRWALLAAIPFAMTRWEMQLLIAGILAAVAIPIEWRRASLRRKLPMTRWPSRLFM